MGLVPLFVKVVRLGADRLGEGHQLAHPLVAIVLFVVADAEVAEVGQRAAVRQVDLPHDFRQPGAVGREATVIFHDHVDVVLRGKLGQRPQSIGRAIDLVLVAAAAGRIDADRMATRASWPPRPTCNDSRRPSSVAAKFGVAQISFAVAHDQHVLDTHDRRPAGSGRPGRPGLPPCP